MKEKVTPSGLTLIVRNDVEPTGQCYTCGVPFFSREEGEAHMGPCARRHLDDLRDRDTRLEIFKSHPDPEIEEHWKKVGKKMLAEGRMTVDKSETATG